MRYRPAEIALLLAVAACATPDSKPPLSKAPPATSSSTGVKIGKPYEVFGKTYYPKDDITYDQRGIASWYGPGFHALATANGEKYDQDDITAAHKTLPMPSWVEVENLDNGRKLAVRINDRGPFVEGRIIDLSRKSAQLLGVDKIGLAKVRVRRILSETPPKTTPNPPQITPETPPQTPDLIPEVMTIALKNPEKTPISSVYIQVAALSDPGRIAWLKGFLGAFGPVITQVTPIGLTRIRLGPYNDAAAANTTLAQVQSAGYADARIVKP